MNGNKLQSDQERSGDVERGNEKKACPAGASRGRSAVAETDCEVQKERRLESRGDEISPVDGLVKAIEHTGVFEGVENERDKAENVEMGGLGSSPATEEDVDADGEIGERDQTEAVIA